MASSIVKDKVIYNGRIGNSKIYISFYSSKRKEIKKYYFVNDEISFYHSFFYSNLNYTYYLL